MADRKTKYFTKSDLYDSLERQYYGNLAYIVIKREFVDNFIKDFYQLIYEKLVNKYMVELNQFGSFKIIADKKPSVITQFGLTLPG